MPSGLLSSHCGVRCLGSGAPRHARKAGACAKATPEDLHGGLGVGIVGRLEAQLRESQALEELPQGADEMPEGEAPITDHTCRCWQLGWPVCLRLRPLGCTLLCRGGPIKQAMPGE